MVTRTYGLSGSGMDVDKMVSDLMKAQRIPYNQMLQQKTQLEWKKTDFNTLYQSINKFRSSLFNYKMQSTLVPKIVSSNNELYVSATANADAVNVSHTVNVTQLASAARTSSSGPLGSVAGAANLSDQFGGSFSGVKTFTITNNGQSKDISIDTSSKTVYDLVSAINTGTDIGVRASYDATVDRFYLSTTNSGKTASLNVTGADSGWFTGTFDLTNNVTGTNANFVLDGSAYGDSSNITSNTFTIAGVTYNLKNTTGGADVSLAVSNDIDKTVTTIKNLVDSYNDLITQINSKLSETYYKDYLPLTDDQKSAMKDSDITAWELKSKSGLLRNNPILRNLLDKVRSDFSGPISGVSGKYNSAASIGISTGNYFENGSATGESALGGVLYVDETKLRNALQADPNAAYKIFGTDGADHDHDGVVTRVYDSLKTYMDQIKTEAGSVASPNDLSNEGKRIADYTKRLSDMQSSLDMIQDRYYKQFDAMEQAISRLNQQSAWLAQSFGGSSSSNS